MNIILLGLPGSGKGTQAELLSGKFSLFYLQTGRLSRKWAKTDPEIKKITDSGRLIPEDKMTEFVHNFLEDKIPDGKNILFEGYPRYVTQYQFLEKWLNGKNEKIDAVVFLDISQKEAIKRLVSRRTCKKCGEVYNLITNPPKAGICKCGGSLVQRKDDIPQAIKTRFLVYKENTKEVVDYAKDKGTLINIDADRPIDLIHKDIVSKLQKYV
jgi:adenylate kinase